MYFVACWVQIFINFQLGPGPAKYMLPPTIGYNNHDFTRERLPMYSMAPKFPYNKANVGPGAAKYNLEYKSHVGVKHINAYMGYQFVPLSKLPKSSVI